MGRQPPHYFFNARADERHLRDIRKNADLALVMYGNCIHTKTVLHRVGMGLRLAEPAPPAPAVLRITPGARHGTGPRAPANSPRSPPRPLWSQAGSAEPAAARRPAALPADAGAACLGGTARRRSPAWRARPHGMPPAAALPLLLPLQLLGLLRLLLLLLRLLLLRRANRALS